MRVIDCPVCGSKVNALVHHCPECGADPRLPREEAEADLRARGIAPAAPAPGATAAQPPPETRPPMTPAAAAPEGQTS